MMTNLKITIVLEAKMLSDKELKKFFNTLYKHNDNNGVAFENVDKILSLSKRKFYVTRIQQGINNSVTRQHANVLHSEIDIIA